MNLKWALTTNQTARIKLRFEWDWKGAERELRRANELKTDYPSRASMVRRISSQQTTL